MEYTHTIRVSIRVRYEDSAHEATHEWFEIDNEGPAFNIANCLLSCLNDLRHIAGMYTLANAVSLDPGVIWPHNPCAELEEACDTFVSAANKLIEVYKHGQEENNEESQKEGNEETTGNSNS